METTAAEDLSAMFSMKRSLALAALALAQLSGALGQVRIMPLGDSITGSPVGTFEDSESCLHVSRSMQGCWRATLYNNLRNSGFTNIDMVGTLPTQGCGVSYDGDNEGHGGFLGTNIANQNQLVGWLSSTRPDIVIMHLGTNDVWNNIAAGTITTAFSKLVDQMRASNPNMKILVSGGIHLLFCNIC